MAPWDLPLDPPLGDAVSVYGGEMCVCVGVCVCSKCVGGE